MNDSYIDLDPTVGAGKAVAITPSNTVQIPTTRGIYVGTTGDLRVTLHRDVSAVTFVGVLAGTLLPIRAKLVLSTGTTALNLLALY